MEQARAPVRFLERDEQRHERVRHTDLAQDLPRARFHALHRGEDGPLAAGDNRRLKGFLQPLQQALRVDVRELPLADLRNKSLDLRRRRLQQISKLRPRFLLKLLKSRLRLEFTDHLLDLRARLPLQLLELLRALLRLDLAAELPEALPHRLLELLELAEGGRLLELRQRELRRLRLLILLRLRAGGLHLRQEQRHRFLHLLTAGELRLRSDVRAQSSSTSSTLATASKL